jgi:hypothetical protein
MSNTGTTTINVRFGNSAHRPKGGYGSASVRNVLRSTRSTARSGPCVKPKRTRRKRRCERSCWPTSNQWGARDENPRRNRRRSDTKARLG